MNEWTGKAMETVRQTSPLIKLIIVKVFSLDFVSDSLIFLSTLLIHPKGAVAVITLQPVSVWEKTYSVLPLIGTRSKLSIPNDISLWSDEKGACTQEEFIDWHLHRNKIWSLLSRLSTYTINVQTIWTWPSHRIVTWLHHFGAFTFDYDFVRSSFDGAG